MALVGGTYTRYDAKGLREQLSNIISDISPTQTPFMSGIGVGEKAVQTLVEWQTDALAAADGTNAQLEGDDVTFTTPSATVRVGNYTQISRKSVIISDTLEEVDKAGRRSEMALQTMKKAKELKRDMETIFLRAQGGAAGAAGTARTAAGMLAWIKSNVSLEATGGGANPSWTSGVPGSARTDSSAQRAFTETLLKAVLQSGYTNGSEFSVLMLGAFNKGVASGFSGIATRNFDLSNVSPKPTAIIASADVYVGDFHTLRVIPNRFQRARDAWLLDWEFASVRYLRPFKRKNLAKTGDADKKYLVVEYTLEVKNEAAFGLVADLTTA
jgi:hypothetical protein